MSGIEARLAEVLARLSDVEHHTSPVLGWMRLNHAHAKSLGAVQQYAAIDHLTEALAATKEVAAALAVVVAEEVTAARAEAWEQMAVAIRSERHGYLSSPNLSGAWIAGWHSATEHHAARIARANPPSSIGVGGAGDGAVGGANA